MYPGSPSPVCPRLPAGRHVGARLGEPGYKRAEPAIVPGLAEPGLSAPPGRASRRGPARRAGVQAGRARHCTRARRARSVRASRPGVSLGPGSASRGTSGPSRALYPGSPSPVCPRLPAGRHVGARLGEPGLVPGLAEPGLSALPGGASRRDPARRAGVQAGRARHCTRARRARSVRASRPGVASRPGSASRGTGGPGYRRAGLQMADTAAGISRGVATIGSAPAASSSSRGP